MPSFFEGLASGVDKGLERRRLQKNQADEQNLEMLKLYLLNEQKKNELSRRDAENKAEEDLKIRLQEMADKRAFSLAKMMADRQEKSLESAEERAYNRDQSQLKKGILSQLMQTQRKTGSFNEQDLELAQQIDPEAAFEESTGFLGIPGFTRKVLGEPKKGKITFSKKIAPNKLQPFQNRTAQEEPMGVNEPIMFENAEEVRDAYQKGSITKDEARSIIKNKQFRVK